MSSSFKVIIIGAGTGGLCLAQGLKADGVPVEVFERERTATDRQGGYKLTISPTGNRALKECLPESVFQKLVQSSARASRDGANSYVRARLLPYTQRVETGVMAVSGRIGLNEQVRALTPPAIFRGPTLMLGPRGCFLFANAMEYEDGSVLGSCPEANRFGVLSGDRQEYVMWGFSARREKFAPF